jgi:peptide deformylase
MIITDKSELETPCEIVSITEGEEIGVRLLHELRNSKTAGVGLAANQIGINKQVCVINVKKPLVLINPKIVEKSEEQFVFPEGCLSFPKKYVRTLRHTSVTVEADNHDIDHLEGITMFDRKFVKPAAVSKKIGRNEKVTIEKGSESKTLKYKKAEALLEDGWTLSKV